MALGLIAAVALLATSACAQPTGAPSPPDPVSTPPATADAVEAPAANDAGGEETEAAPASQTVTLGSALVEVVVHALDGPMAGTFNALNLHDNESTSVDAALDVVRARGGRVVELVHTGERNATFRVEGPEAFVADPNRMFTGAGRRRTLADQSRDTPDARGALEAFADAVLDVYAPGPPAVVTLHNNTDENYTATSYVAGGAYASDAAAVTVHEGTDPDDFFFVTDRALYDALVARGFNAVLQDNEAATDDGSLSVWAAREGVPYVNVEAQHGHRAEQARMIEALMDVLAGSE